ncbi:MAG: hypothetical protein H0V07_14750 [Propionibacteriales bacterium]|nr:hypothetical protein [Propionibacteriales bacterium]
MSDPADVLMLSGVTRPCPDCHDERIFMPIDECDGDGCEFCCTSCGAALLVDPAFEVAIVIAPVTRVA